VEAGKARMHVFPNPVPSGNALVTVQLQGSDRAMLRLSDAAGRVLRTWAMPSMTGRHARVLDLSGLPAGAYQLELLGTGSLAVARVVIGG